MAHWTRLAGADIVPPTRNLGYPAGAGPAPTGDRMSVKIVCDNCGRVIYSAAAQTLLASGYRCPACGAVPSIADEDEDGEPAPSGNAA